MRAAAARCLCAAALQFVLLASSPSVVATTLHGGVPPSGLAPPPCLPGFAPATASCIDQVTVVGTMNVTFARLQYDPTPAEPDGVEPDESYCEPSAHDYRGTVSVTRSGRTCQVWAAQTPHSHTRTPSNYPESGLDGEHNYCRNPNGEPTAWCYTTDPGRFWDTCDVGVVLEAGSDACSVPVIIGLDQLDGVSVILGGLVTTADDTPVTEGCAVAGQPTTGCGFNTAPYNIIQYDTSGTSLEDQASALIDNEHIRSGTVRGPGSWLVSPAGASNDCSTRLYATIDLGGFYPG